MKFRKWLKKNDFEAIFKAKGIYKAKHILNKRFNETYTKPPYTLMPLDSNSNLLVVSSESKNKTNIENNSFDLKHFESELDEYVKQWYNAFQCPISRKISKFKYLLKRDNQEIKSKIDEVFTDGFTNNYGIDHLKEKFKIAKTLNYHIISLLIKYFRWTYKADTKSFDKVVLEDFGLACCSNCAKIGKENFLKNQKKD